MKTDLLNTDYFSIYNKKFGVNSFVFGAKVKQQLNNNFYFAVQSNFSKKSVIGATRADFVFNETVKFNYIQNTLSIYYSYRNFFCSIGGAYNFLNKLAYTADNLKILSLGKSLNEQGGRFSMGIQYNKFNLEAYFYKGFTSNLDSKFFPLKTIESLGLLLSYDIKCFDKF